MDKTKVAMFRKEKNANEKPLKGNSQTYWLIGWGYKGYRVIEDVSQVSISGE